MLSFSISVREIWSKWCCRLFSSFGLLSVLCLCCIDRYGRKSRSARLLFAENIFYALCVLLGCCPLFFVGFWSLSLCLLFPPGNGSWLNWACMRMKRVGWKSGMTSIARTTHNGYYLEYFWSNLDKCKVLNPWESHQNHPNYMLSWALNNKQKKMEEYMYKHLFFAASCGLLHSEVLEKWETTFVCSFFFGSVLFGLPCIVCTMWVVWQSHSIGL